MAELEERLTAIGCPKINLLIEADNARVVPFYQALGYQADDLIFMEKYLITARRRELLPELSDEPYVFAAAAASPLPETAMFAAILEDESLTLPRRWYRAGALTAQVWGFTLVARSVMAEEMGRAYAEVRGFAVPDRGLACCSGWCPRRSHCFLA